ncbi:putative vitellogenin receptor [Venturia canescens]|uniref:putative vitellogenin receptor n=1 Tax=Venturia canescens TaxID=32260 RepID=UPI001C9BE5AF|nr:putative vitellogenin receptor [Venturia canescens]
MSSSRVSLVIGACLLAVVAPIVFTETEADTVDEGFLFYTTGSAIHEIGLKSHVENIFAADPSRRYVGVAVTENPNIVYWSTINVKEKTIMQTLRDYETTAIVVDRGLVAPEQLAVDWVTGNVYFIDTYKKHIAVCKKDGSACAVIMDNAAMLDSPGGLVVNSNAGDMFWADYGRNPVIWRAKMDGSHTRPIVAENLGSPKDLAIDYKEERLYWVDSKSMTIESVKYDGSDRQIFLNATGMVLRSIAILGDEIYWSDLRTRTIRSMNMFNGEEQKVVVESSSYIYDIDIYHPALKPQLQNPCKNNGCLEMCLLTGGLEHSCVCKLGSKKQDELSEACTPEDEPHKLVVAAGDRILLYHHETLGKIRIEEILTPILLSRITYDRGSKDLIADDLLTNSIFTINTENREVRRIVKIAGDGIGDIDFDDGKERIIWTDPSRRSIDQRSRRFESTTISSRYFVDEPQEYVRIPGRKESFVVFKSKSRGLHLDWLHEVEPREIKTVVSKLVGPKISLAYEEKSKTVYIADEGAQTIHYFSSNASESYDPRPLLCTGIESPVSLAISHDKLFWTVRNSSLLQWADIYAGYQKARSGILPVKNVVGIMDITAIDTSTV